MLPPNNLDNSFIKPLTPGEVARLAVTERDAGTDVFGCVGYLLFSGEEKRSKKVVGTLATVSRAKAPGRNYKLLPALAIKSPPGF